MPQPTEQYDGRLKFGIIGENSIVPRIVPPTLEDVVAEWEVLDFAQIVTPEFRDNVIDVYREFHNMHNGDPGAKRIHNTLTDGIYSRHNLPALRALHEWSIAHDDYEMKQSSGKAIFALSSALGFFHDYAERNGCDFSEALAELRGSIIGGDTSFITFLGIMDRAKKLAARSIWENIRKLPADLPILIGKSQPDTWLHRANHALSEFVESEVGFDIGPDFAEKLRNPGTKAFVLSMDINSTLNVAESYSNPQYLEALMARMKKMADRFHKTFPKKELYIVLNTGRPALYEWGVSDVIAALPEMRRFHLAEAGGVIVHVDGSQIHPEVAVENSDQWQIQLDNLKRFILKDIKDHKATVEPKLSMLSIQIAKRGEDGGNLLLTATDGQPVTEDWIKDKVQEFRKNQRLELNKNIKEILDRMRNMPEAEKYIAMLQQAGEAGPDGIRGTPDDLPKQTLEALQAAFQDAKEFRTSELRDLQEALKILDEMDKKLDANLNTTAGYVDISHRDFNKYSSLVRQMKVEGFQPAEMVVVHIGDSKTDEVKNELTGPGEVNEGAKEVFLLGVENSSSDFKNIIRSRLDGVQHRRGAITARQDVLGVSDIVLHIIRVIEESAPSTA